MKKKLERDIQLEICEWLLKEGYFFWRYRYMSRFPIKFVPRGLPDIMILYKGKFICIEVKVPDYWKHTDEQIKMSEKISDNGGYCKVATSLDEAKIIMDIAKDSLC